MLYDYIQTPPTCCSLCGGTLTTKAGHHGFYAGTILKQVFGNFCISCWDRHGDNKGKYYENRMLTAEPSTLSDNPDAIFAEWRKDWLKKFDIDVNDITADGIFNVFTYDTFPELRTRGHIFKLVSWGHKLIESKVPVIKFDFYLDNFIFMANIPCVCVTFWQTPTILTVWNRDRNEYEIQRL